MAEVDDRTEYESPRRREPLVFEDRELGCVVRLDSWMQRKKVPGQKWELHAFGVNLSYMELGDVPDGEFRDVLRYDCEHYHVEVHRFWESRHPVELEAFRDQPLGEAYRFCERDLRRHYRDYIRKLRRRLGQNGEDGD